MRGINLVVGVIGDISGLEKSLGAAGKEVKGFGGINLGTAAKITAVAGAVGVAVGGLFELAKAAESDRTESRKLQAAIEAAGAATGDYMTIVDAAIAQGQAKAFSDSETRAGLESLVRATGDVATATGMLAGAQDIARLAGVSLETASDALSKAYLGNDGALTKLLPGLAKGATGMDTIANATAMAKGQADIFASSAEGGAARAADSMGELGETVGEVLLPILDALVPAIIPILEGFGKLVKAILPVLIPMVQLLAKVFGFVATAIGGVLGFVVDLINWVGKLLAPIGDLIDALSRLNPFGGIIDAITGGGYPSGATGGSVPQLNATFNIYGDPAVIERTVVTTLRDYSRRNGYETLGLGQRER